MISNGQKVRRIYFTYFGEFEEVFINMKV